GWRDLFDLFDSGPSAATGNRALRRSQPIANILDDERMYATSLITNGNQREGGMCVNRRYGCIDSEYGDLRCVCDGRYSYLICLCSNHEVFLAWTCAYGADTALLAPFPGVSPVRNRPGANCPLTPPRGHHQPLARENSDAHNPTLILAD